MCICMASQILTRISEKWEDPPINQASKEITRLHELIRKHEAANEQLNKELKLLIQEQVDILISKNQALQMLCHKHHVYKTS